MQGNWENWRNSFWWSANREFFLSENDFKRSSEIQKFSRENVDIFWWSANRDKICKVVRESEKVENRCRRLRLKSSKIEHFRGGGVCSAPQDSLAVYIRNRLQRGTIGKKDKYGLRFRRIELMAHVAERSL